MRITDVEAILLRGDQAYGATAGAQEAVDNGDWQLIVRVATDEGLVGWADVETLAPAAAAIIAGQGMAILGFKTLSELLIGENPLDVEAIWEKLYIGSAYYGRRGVAMHCISAIDNCLWSIRAEAAGMSLARLLGGRRRDRITAYASTLFRSTPEGMAAAARVYVEKGYRAVKFGWGVFGQDPGRDRELVAAAREALGPDRDLLVDPGWYPAGWTEPGPMRSRREGSQSMAPVAPRWMVRLISPSTASTIGNTTLRRLPVAMRGIASTTARIGRNATSRPMASHAGTPGRTSATRPAIHSAASAPRPAPVAVRRPVQLLAAVSRKPAITAAAKPNTISCACQMVGGRCENGSSTPR